MTSAAPVPAPSLLALAQAAADALRLALETEHDAAGEVLSGSVKTSARIALGYDRRRASEEIKRLAASFTDRGDLVVLALKIAKAAREGYATEAMADRLVAMAREAEANAVEEG